MLAKLETTYLGILRVIILIVATIALAVAALALISAVPPLIRKITTSHDQSVPQPSLASFIDEKKVEGTTSISASGISATPLKNTDVVTAATNLVRYLKGRSRVSPSDWEALIEKSDNPIIILHSLDYYPSVRKLTEELLAARGKPLSLERIGELLTWHQQRFVEAVNQADAEQTADTAKSTSTLMVAGGAFLFFTLIVFIFLFVKIERSLRVVQVVRADEVATNDAL